MTFISLSGTCYQSRLHIELELKIDSRIDFRAVPERLIAVYILMKKVI
jgi:hypothetical protein